MNVADLLSHLDSLLSSKTFQDYGPNGLQVGNLQAPIKTIAVAVTADLQTIKQAVAASANTLIVHHGIFWKGMPYPITDMIYKRIELLIKHNIQLIAYHLPLDAHPTLGNNWRVALDLNWNDLQPFGSSIPYLGVQGSFPPLHIDTFIDLLSQYYQSPLKASALGGPSIISSAALVSGGAYRELSLAAACQLDCFITGNFDEPAWSIALENNINFLAFGHTATEKVGPKSLVSYLKSQFSIPTIFIDTANPF
ncbi:Nif3-like dinuclear metal center hexameric protein [Candidatus Chlamydia corallus]|uniref:Nif3-like dinuclear metal center hexameric protein n=1 Tax=Candidatus Chlamydia corallus TaxID=2038470 RepID=UPI000C2FE2F2|nr:Nif3-like dinuclear metal center hexameric protein [Candidatus Chlamydia corallus]